MTRWSLRRAPVPDEARMILGEWVGRLRVLPHGELLDRYSEVQVVDISHAPSGTPYQVEIESFWDDRKKQNLRVLVTVWPGETAPAFKPISDDFIMAPDGTFIGE
jgi:hypothetical protein